MSKITNWPPTQNEAAPPLNNKVRQSLSSIHRIEGQFPLFRIVWGQWSEVGYVYAGEWHLTYRHHVNREGLLGEPEIGLDGKVATNADGSIRFKTLYSRGDVLPAIPLIPIDRCEDIGINRWFVELAEPVDETEWNATRYQDEQGQIRVDSDGNPLDFAGSFPDGGIDYQELYCVARHDERCCSGTQLHPTLKTRCYGHYREPSMMDVEACTAKWKEMQEKRNETYDFRGKIPDAVLANAATAAVGRLQEAKTLRREEIEDELMQLLSPHTKRVADSTEQRLSGLDKFKYSDLGSTLAKLRENESNPEAYSGKAKD